MYIGFIRFFFFFFIDKIPKTAKFWFPESQDIAKNTTDVLMVYYIFHTDFWCHSFFVTNMNSERLNPSNILLDAWQSPIIFSFMELSFHHEDSGSGSIPDSRHFSKEFFPKKFFWVLERLRSLVRKCNPLKNQKLHKDSSCWVRLNRLSNNVYFYQ